MAIRTSAGLIRHLILRGAQDSMHNHWVLGVLALAAVSVAGCTGVSGPPLVHSDIPDGTADMQVSGTRHEPLSNDNDTATLDCIERTGDPRTYPINITAANNHTLNRKEFLEVNREYIVYLARELGEEKANQMVNDQYRRSIGPSLLDPASGEDTLISLDVDPVDDHMAGETLDISGSTNLPAGRNLTLIIFRGNYDRAILPCEDPWHDPVLRTAVVKRGPASKNTWSYRLNTSGLIADDYLVYVRETGKDAFLANSLFHLF
jgi:hypothetical protein